MLTGLPTRITAFKSTEMILKQAMNRAKLNWPCCNSQGMITLLNNVFYNVINGNIGCKRLVTNNRCRHFGITVSIPQTELPLTNNRKRKTVTLKNKMVIG